MDKVYSIIRSLIIGLLFSIQVVAQSDEGFSQSQMTDICVEIGTYLGNWHRNYYGNEAPSALNMIWKSYLGHGTTVISRKIGKKVWAGSGWTGQPLLIEENGRPFLIIGAFDHNLKKIDARTGHVQWQCSFDDVIKGTGTLWINPNASNLQNKVIILQGSRLGTQYNLDAPCIPSYRAVSYFTGKELWRLNVPRTRSYSRDVDGSAVVIGNTVYIGLENGTFVALDPDPDLTLKIDGAWQPYIYDVWPLYTEKDVTRHGGNLVTEASPCVLNDHIYIAAGSGHLYGYSIDSSRIDWDFYIGSDIDGSPVVTSDSCILVAVEKQYIQGRGGILKLNPTRKPSEAVEWFFPTLDKQVELWMGGVIGSACVNDLTKQEEDPFLAAFTGIDGYLYVVRYRAIDSGKEKVFGPRQKHLYSVPVLVFKKYIGPSISTPIFVGNKLIAGGYSGLYLFEYDGEAKFTMLDRISGRTFESTPIVFNRRVYIGSRDGYLYCLGDEH